MQNLSSFLSKKPYSSSSPLKTIQQQELVSYTVCFLKTKFLIFMSLLPSVATLFCLHCPLPADQLCSVLSPPLLDLLDVLDANGTAATGTERPRLFPGWAFPRNDQWLTVGMEKKVRHTMERILPSHNYSYTVYSPWPNWLLKWNESI